jgi:hypothetical protein
LFFNQPMCVVCCCSSAFYAQVNASGTLSQFCSQTQAPAAACKLQQENAPNFVMVNVHISQSTNYFWRYERSYIETTIIFVLELASVLQLTLAVHSSGARDKKKKKNGAASSVFVVV